MPPATEHDKSSAPRVDLRSAIGLLQSYHTAIDGKPDAEKLSLVDYLRQRPDMLDVNELTIGDVDELTGLYRAATQEYDGSLGQASDEAPLGATNKAPKQTDAGGRLSPEAGRRRPRIQQASTAGFRARPSSSWRENEEKIEVPDEWAQEFSQVVQESVMVDQLPGGLTDDPAEDPDAQFSVGRSSAKRPQPELQPHLEQDKCPVFSCSEPPLVGFRHCLTHVNFAKSLLQDPPGGSEWMKQLHFLREWVTGCQKDASHIWALDVEFDVLNFATPIAFTIAIKDFRTGRDVINTRVGHGGLTADEMIEEYHDKCPDGFQLHKRTENGFRKAFQRYYPGGMAFGTEFSEMQDTILKAGFDPRTHAVISYSTNLDLQVFWKVLSGIDEPFVAPTVKENFQLRNGLNYYTCLQTVNIQHVAKNMLKSAPRDGCSLTGIYRTLFGIEDVTAHEAPADTLMLLDIIRIIAAFESGH
ncbi:uncharacterized protein J4E88_004564 [Alternaria novae-zelandiae]|uniref:uncharacterized protein n=1 Tax=Alternaria novae-zelandiae TaxID=430562 RepID=UPI0020C3158E|nr:uncharacterized protein J4E88_004564 [Alternaria novae-zelandiae]KAI4683388.1 hypothetical protein J4E88_004564 [Alternaria novae-zelandiae]